MLPERKRNRLAEYDYSGFGSYFLTICTKDKATILSEIVGVGALDDPLVELSPVGQIVDKYINSTNKIKNVIVDKYVIMPNHIHMLITVTADLRDVGAPSPTNDLIPRAVSALKRLSNAEIGEKIFQRSYYDHIIRNQQDYDAIWKYIDENPLNWTRDEFYNR